MTLVQSVPRMPVIHDGAFHATVVDFDRFGNPELNVTSKDGEASAAGEARIHLV